jgi:endoglucanase
MTSRISQQQSERVLTIRNVWMEGKAPIPRSPISIYETNIDNLLGLFLGKGTSILLGLDENTTRPVSIVNKLSGKALEVENCSVNQGARIQQGTWTDTPNQRWFVTRTKFSKHMPIPASIYREVHRFCSTFLPFSKSAYSVIADHSGLCLDFVSGSTESAEAVQKLPLIGGSSHLWAFVPDRKRFNFIVNLCSGRVLDVMDSSLINCATVHQYPFDGRDSQRWQLLT